MKRITLAVFSHCRVLKGTILLVFILGSCNATKNTSTSKETTNDHNPDVVSPRSHEGSPLSWENLFRRVPGVQILGSYPDLSLRIRGANSMHLTTEPLFVLEGVPLGHQFSGLDKAVTPGDVESIQVLKGPDATIYGSRGANGVVVVKMKKGAK